MKKNLFRKMLVFSLIFVFSTYFIPLAQVWSAQSCQEYDIPMRDGVKLYTRVFLPDPDIWGPGPYPTIVVTTPYGVGGYGGRGKCSAALPNLQASNGYAYVYQDTRGRYLSEGVWTRVNDGQDGYDTIQWVAKQPWCNGKIGMGGLSAMGITTYMTAGERPPQLVAIAPSIASANSIQNFSFEGGALEYETTLAWRASNVYNGLSQSHYDSLGLTPEELAAAKTEMAMVYADVMGNLPNPLVSPSWMRLPLYNFPGISKLLPQWNDVLLHPSSLDPLYAPFNVQDKIKVPGLHMGGWYDMFSRGTLEAYKKIDKKVGQQKLVMTNLTHLQFAYTFPYWSYYFKWFDYWLKGIDNGIMDEPPIYYYRMGVNKWAYADAWPLPDVEEKIYYLHSDGSLSPKHPQTKEAPLSYNYDPKNPLLTLGGRNLYYSSGPADQSPMEPPNRDDVLVYTSEVLKNDVEISGNVKVILHASSNCRDTDFVAKLIDVYPDGKKILVLDGVIRARYRDSLKKEKLLHPGQVYEFVIDLGDTSQVFKAGHRIQIDISSSNFPRRDRNTNTGHALYVIDTADDALIATNTIYHDKLRPSFVVLPVVNPKTRVFSGQAKIKTPSLNYAGPAELHTLAKGVYLRLINLDNRWLKWEIEKDLDTRFVDYFKCEGKLGKLSVWVHAEGCEPYFALAWGKGILFEGSPAIDP